MEKNRFPVNLVIMSKFHYYCAALFVITIYARKQFSDGTADIFGINN